MAEDLARIDPQSAWSLFEPDERMPFDRRLAAHLYRRAGYAATTDELDRAVEQGPAATVDRLFAASERDEFHEHIEQLAATVVSRSNPQALSAWWLYRMVHTPDQLLDKQTLFWHGHFATSAAKVRDARLMLDQHRLLRRHALGPFGPLVQDISRDTAMLIYLDSATNRKRHPNENYARELLELFCLGEGNYTEEDIRELARALTGWEVRRGRVSFNEYQHDTGEVTIFGRRGRFDSRQAIEIVLAQPAAARWIAGKLFRWLVRDEPAAPDALIEPLAADLRANKLDVGRLVRRILTSRLFFSPHAVGRKIRSPVELGVGLLRALEGTTNMVRLAADLRGLGHDVFFPPNVKGWDGGRTWINSATLLGRANLVDRLVHDEQSRFASGTLAELADRHGADSPERTVQWLLDLLVAVPLPAEVRSRLVDAASQGRSDRSAVLARLIQLIGTLPEFQLA